MNELFEESIHQGEMLVGAHLLQPAIDLLDLHAVSTNDTRAALIRRIILEWLKNRQSVFKAKTEEDHMTALIEKIANDIWSEFKLYLTVISDKNEQQKAIQEYKDTIKERMERRLSAKLAKKVMEEIERAEENIINSASEG